MSKSEDNRSNPKRVLVLMGISAAVIVLLVVGFLAFRDNRIKEANRIAGCSFSTEGFENVTDVICLGEKIAVFTDTTGKKGIMTLDGEISEAAQQDRIYMISDDWRSYKFLAEGPLSEYRLLVDADSGTVTGKQYHGITSPEFSVCWSAEGGHVAKFDEKGYAGEVFSGEYALDEGLYPIAESTEKNAKYGFVNERMLLDIDFLYDAAGDFSEGLAPVRKGGSWGYINKKGGMAVKMDLESICDSGAYTFRNGLAPVRRDGKCGIIGRSGNTVVAFNFEDILQGKDGKYIAKKNGKWGVLTVNENLFNAENTTTAVETSQSKISEGNYVVRTAGSVLNLRATADGSSAIVGKIPNGTKINVTKSVNGWAYTVYNSVSGWVSTDYIVEIETTTQQTEETVPVG